MLIEIENFSKEGKLETKEREWRNSELSRTDLPASVPDRPDLDSLWAYRTALRNYPSQPDFPNGTRPVEGATP